MKEIINQLSSREKKMLYFLICFLLILGAWLLIITPLLDQRSSLTQQYDFAQAENLQKQSDLTLIQSAPGLLEQQKEVIQTKINDYQSLLEDEDIDRLLTTLVLSNSLNPRSLQIGEITDVTATTDSSSTESTQATTEETTTATQSYVRQVTVALTVSGSLTNITRTVDDLNNMKGMQISSISYTATTDQTQATINVTLYMVNN